ncbi:MAG: glycosyltransferase family 39 protein, partial [Kiritimatiellae bacterium]|nr:glycosyltransferase family 39 protein [Kiritimatiellia bacterium]
MKITGLCIVSALCLLQLGLWGGTAWYKPLWFDEIFTMYTATFDGWEHFQWLRMHAGDFNPPLTPLLARAAMRIGGDHPFVIRLPFLFSYILAVATTIVCTWKRLGLHAGFIAGAMATGPVFYATEARGYASMFAGGALAYFFWARASHSPRRARDVAAFAASLTFAMASHFYAVFLLVPFGLGELRKWMDHRRPDWLLWAAASLSLLPILTSLNVLAYARSFSDDYHASVSAFSLLQGYRFPLFPPRYSLLSALGFLLLAAVARRSPRQVHPPFFSSAERWCIAGFLLIPLAGFLVAIFVTGVYSPRHYITACFGTSIAVAYVSHRVFRGNPRLLSLFAGLILACSLWRQGLDLRQHMVAHDTIRLLTRHLMEETRGLPFAVHAPNAFLQHAVALPASH